MIENRREINCFFFFKQKTAYEIYQCDWSSDVCSSDLEVSCGSKRETAEELRRAGGSQARQDEEAREQDRDRKSVV